jgi:hypothetical protein
VVCMCKQTHGVQTWLSKGNHSYLWHFSLLCWFSDKYWKFQSVAVSVQWTARQVKTIEFLQFIFNFTTSIYRTITYIENILEFLYNIPTNPHWARVVGYGPFSLWVIHKEGLCPSSGEINRLMVTLMMMYNVTRYQSALDSCGG